MKYLLSLFDPVFEVQTVCLSFSRGSQRHITNGISRPKFIKVSYKHADLIIDIHI